MSSALTAMPPGYQLQYYDDCGMPGRQPHVRAEGVHTYSTASVNAGEKARSVAWGWREVKAVYDGLRPDLDYVLAITYANEPFNNRAQSLWAGKIEIHGPYPLPKGGVERLLFRLPREAVAGGNLELSFRLEAQVNVVVSVIELWAAAPAKTELHLEPMAALLSDLNGRALDASWDPVAGAKIELRPAGTARPLGAATSDADGRFTFARKLFDALPTGDLEVVAEHEGLSARRTIAAEDLHYAPLRYRPLPVDEPGVKAAQFSLDGDWRLDPSPGKDVRTSPLAGQNWRPFHVPGQFVEQGYDLPPDKPVALAREFSVPADWAGHRVLLRFDAIYAGARYFVNGRLVGASQNLFTPVEIDVTAAVRFGETNRLDLEMLVDTQSERMSYASGYAFHSLGGVHRSVHLFALPQLHVRDLRVIAGLDGDYRDGLLTLQVGLENLAPRAEAGVTLAIRFSDPDGREVDFGPSARTDVGILPPGARTVDIAAHVPTPAKWNAEKPALYRLVFSLLSGPRLVERFERQVGFRKIETRDGRLLVNGVPVKLAGACHHEIDPVTGRADTMRHAEADVRLFKAANLNYLRTSHYPPTQELLDAADRLGMYIEVEAPFCWVGSDSDQSHLRAVLDPTSAMLDYHGGHPSVLLWSLANESEFNPLFEESARMVKALDPTRPTTFNNPDPKRLCDLANVHYPGMPFDQVYADDPRPLLLGEWDFPVCHEQTDVRVDPGLRELWGAGHSEPESEWGRKCAESYPRPWAQPGEPPGAWSSIVHSKRVLGAAIWAGLDDSFYLPGGKQVGYSWHHGFWGLLDAWRRPKPEWWLSKLIFSPVWFPARHLAFVAGHTSVAVPVENRYSFTDLGELTFAWQWRGHTGKVSASVAPGATGELHVPVPPGAQEGDSILLRVTDSRGELVNVAGMQVGKRPARRLPTPTAGAPKLAQDATSAVVEGDGWSLVLDKATGKFLPADPRHRAAVIDFPTLHLTRFDFGDLATAPPYAVLPDPATRTVEAVTVREIGNAVEMTVRERFTDFEGTTRWTIDRAGVGRVTSDYTYTGDDINAREVGLRLLLRPGCETLSWKRWSEWAEYPADSISRTEGIALAHRDPALGPADDRTAPKWPWSLDETELGTADFRGVKLNVYEAALTSAGGDGVRVEADADRHVRACLDARGVWLHVLTECRMAPVVIHKGDRLGAEYVVALLPTK